MWNYWGYVYFSEEKYDRAMNAYEQLLNEPEATIPLRTASLFTVAQLYMVQGDFKKGIQYILQWMNEVETVTAQSYSHLATAYYQIDEYIKAKNNKISYIGREFASTPATGYAKRHLAQQKEIIDEVFR